MSDVDFDALEQEFSSAETVEGEEDKSTKRTTRRTYVPRKATKRKVAENLLTPWAQLAKGIAFMAPTVSAVLLSRGEKTVDALVDIASEHPRMMAALTKAAQVAPTVELIETGAQVVVALALDTGRMPSDHPVAVLTGVSELYDRVHPDQPQTPQNGVQDVPHNNGFAVAEPPPFMAGNVTPLYQ